MGLERPHAELPAACLPGRAPRPFEAASILARWLRAQSSPDASTSSGTSAVSKPRPNRHLRGHMCHGFVIVKFPVCGGRSGPLLGRISPNSRDLRVLKSPFAMRPRSLGGTPEDTLRSTPEIAYAWRKTSRTRAGVVREFGSCEDTVSSCVDVQNTASPRLVMPVPGASRSNRKMRRLATASSTRVGTRPEMLVSGPRAARHLAPPLGRPAASVGPSAEDPGGGGRPAPRG